MLLGLWKPPEGGSKLRVFLAQQESGIECINQGIGLHSDLFAESRPLSFAPTLMSESPELNSLAGRLSLWYPFAGQAWSNS